MSSIVVANEYTSVHTKAWITPKKKAALGIERKMKGHCSIRGVTYDTPDEMLKAMWKDTDSKLEAYRYPDQDSFKNVEKQTGKQMWWRDLVKNVLKLNPDLFIEDSWGAPGCAGFYKMVGGEKKSTGASFRKGFIPEFTIMGADSADLVTSFTWGWRRVLIMLLKSGDLKWAQINRIWGDVKYGDERAKHWHLNVKEFRV